MREEDLMEEELFSGLTTEFSDDEAAEDDFEMQELPDVERELATLSIALDNDDQVSLVGSGNTNSSNALYGAPAGWEPPGTPANYVPDPPGETKENLLDFQPWTIQDNGHSSLTGQNLVVTEELVTTCTTASQLELLPYQQMLQANALQNSW